MLCEAMFEKSGAALVAGEVTGPERDASGKLIGARLNSGDVVPCDALLFCCGPWTDPKVMLGTDAAGAEAMQMYGVKYHSAVVPTPGGPEASLSQAIFFDGCGDPEVYPRPDGTAYCTGFPDDAITVTERPGEEEVRPDSIAKILSAVRAASSGGGGPSSTSSALSAAPTEEQACYLPTTADGLPMMGGVPGQKGCYVAAGHSCWGILMGPASGEAMAGLVASGGKESGGVNLGPFDPARLVS
eukprot:CAMPEP_0194275216 /NCGR_PEP_ID=MMETSP0169-20130528/8116_1 /TAXON_ID=218684 /ORGANISM="Corethron pennatum, Strain L29A3" /LENGTH=242 /DNA_ID=CAMNT_0039018627 /DNA_START=98 /DNA_END=826 /DNA_ORIENTATION=-